MECIVCRKENPEQANFCMFCGSKLKTVCDCWRLEGLQHECKNPLCCSCRDHDIKLMMKDGYVTTDFSQTVAKDLTNMIATAISAKLPDIMKNLSEQ